MLSFSDCTKLVDDAIAKLNFPDEPKGLYEPINYILDLGGKRLRPSLAILSAALFTKEVDKAIPAAMALEIFHNFTLLHDDIMDKADVRRGKATAHKIWNENTSILSGDAAMILAYDQLKKLPDNQFLKAFMVFNQTAIEVCEGQQYDMDFETRADVSLDEYLEMIRLKTSVLIAASMQIGAIVAEASETDQHALYELGENLGMAFQLQDDYLDVYSDTEKFGKACGGDIINNKKTYLLIKALNSGDRTLVNELQNWIDKKEFNPEEKIAAVKSIFDKLGVADDVQLAAITYINNSIEILNQINATPELKKPLEEIIFKMMYRDK
jgi:geranylgeranyl diphosphate synthase, type II